MLTLFSKNGSLADNIAIDETEYQQQSIFENEFGSITDIEVGPDDDGYLYIVSYGYGRIYKIVPVGIVE